MNNLRKAVMYSALAAALLPGIANAGVDWQFNYADAFTADGAVRGANTPALSPVTNELKFTAESVVTFKDLDGSGGISTGDTFKDYIFLRVDQMFKNGVNVSDVRYGQGFNIPGFEGNHEITIKIMATGHQVNPLEYVADSLTLMNWYFDGGTDAVGGGVLGYTAADFANLASIEDGTIVETSSLIKGAGVNASLIPDGALNMTVSMNDILSTLGNYGEFEILSGNLTLLDITGTVDSNNNRCADSGGGAACSSTTATILAAFGASADDYTFHTKSDGSFSKVPEPATLTLLGIGMLGMGWKARRRAAK